MCKEGLKLTGVPSAQELCSRPGYPSQEQFEKGPTVVIECLEEIPCNPCETACPKHAICVGNPITNLPMIEYEKCIHCGMCISACPGLAIYIKDLTYSQSQASISFPYEYYPLPEVGSTVEMVDRKGRVLCSGQVLRVINPASNKQTAVVTAAYDKAYFNDVVNMKRLKG
ncbi:MAG: 4Fe-4S binding protein [Vescimonas sp.]